MRLPDVVLAEVDTDVSSSAAAKTLWRRQLTKPKRKPRPHKNDSFALVERALWLFLQRLEDCRAREPAGGLEAASKLGRDACFSNDDEVRRAFLFYYSLEMTHREFDSDGYKFRTTWWQKKLFLLREARLADQREKETVDLLERILDIMVGADKDKHDISTRTTHQEPAHETGGGEHEMNQLHSTALLHDHRGHARILSKLYAAVPHESDPRSENISHALSFFSGLYKDGFIARAPTDQRRDFLTQGFIDASRASSALLQGTPRPSAEYDAVVAQVERYRQELGDIDRSARELRESIEESSARSRELRAILSRCFAAGLGTSSSRAA
ncbi:unnamed protein product [Amoebophrya sp. A120]|nr:unnamed protein product [Amoebophrya sp. A120]|eukprot:GSA120T00006452001.1